MTCMIPIISSLLLKKLFFARCNNKVLTLLFATYFVIPSSLAQPATYLDKLSTPDLTQTDPRARFAENGSNYCAPVAVSNSFVWLAEHGYSKLLPGGPVLSNADKTARQIILAKTLSSPEFMNTIADEGTYVDNVLLGIKKYILKQGYSIKQLSYLGFRSNLAEFNTGVRNPRPILLRQGIIGKSAVWLNIGWYQFNSNSNTYLRMGGHWITMVGYCLDNSQNPPKNMLIINNPSPRAGTVSHNDFISLKPISGVLVSRKGLLGFPRPAWGFYKIIGDLQPIPGSNTAILESAIILELY